MRIKKTLYILIPIAFVLFGVGRCSYNMYAGVEEAKTAKTKYESYIQEIKYISNISSDVFDFSDRIKELKAPSELIYLGIEKSENETLDIIKKHSGNSSSLTMQREIGFGTVDGIEIFIFEININNLNDVSKCILYIKK